MKSLRLSPEEGFLLSRVDGATSVKELVALTGFDEGRVAGIVQRLAEQGALDTGEPAAAPAPSRMPEKQSGADRDAEALAAEREAREKEEEALAEAGADGANPDEEPEQTKEEAENEARNEADYRRIYMELYSQTSRDVRLKAAAEVSGAELLALCFDPDPQIIHALLTNPTAGLNHARLIAFHHHTQMGLEAISKRADFVRDAQVQRKLLRNQQLPITIFNKVMMPKSLLDTYKIAIDRDVPERTRGLVRETLRKKFLLAASDEKAALLWKTEARCLVVLVQVTLDMHTTNILCSKNNYSVIFIQNLARWPATPPALLAHLLKLNVIRRSPGLAKMILKHPNVPAEAKRNFIR